MDNICVTSIGPGMESQLDLRFGRAVYFVITDKKGKFIKSIKNPGVQADRGAGVVAAQAAANEKAGVVITGNIGPNAFLALESSGIKVFVTDLAMTVSRAVEEYKKGVLKPAKKASVGRTGRGGFGFGRHRKGF